MSAPEKQPLGARVALAAALFLTGVLGIAIHASSLYTRTLSAPLPALNTLLALLTAAAAGEALALQPAARARCSPLARGAAARRCRAGCAVATPAAVALAAVLFAVGFRPDAMGWCFALLAALALTAEALVADARAGERGGAGDGGALLAAAPGAVNAAAPGAAPLCADASAATVRVADDKVYSAVAGGAGGGAAAGGGGGGGGGALAAGDEASASAPGAAPSSSSSSSPGACAPARECCCPPAGTRAGARALFWLRGAAWCVGAVVAVMLLGGAGTLAVGWRRYAPRGSWYTVRAGGASVRMFAYCAGAPAGGAAPTVFLDVGGGGHSSSDVYGLMDALAALGRRVCVADPPGTGRSPLGGADAGALDGPWALELLGAMGEAGPFVLVGTMDGGAERIYLAALAAPAAVAALVPMQFGEGEFFQYALYKRLSDADARAYARATVAARLSFCDVIRFLGTSWGVVSVAVGPAKAGYVGAWDEKNVLNLYQEGQWDMQCRFLASQVADPATALRPSAWSTRRTLAPGVRVLALDNPNPDPCAGGLIKGDECELAKWAVARNTAFMRGMANMTANSTYAAVVSDGWLGDGDSPVRDLAARIAAFA